ncbi:hypothetical protein LJ656_08920 [Paraburkholderia sp. MMS20-SJTR3]|uniref:Uncharacterized protein n=1 Tax=Paraburkholderia sejongensis TaxID=2886946 RepID=A0ABS8JS23_9BURK|nr:hypothetical protein [Paraburkholderia sp. MMS20-SJTR3]MCC8392708.1 hypothetical protein [Paraburkholderia sp. MMS20-SJTR3]
MPRDVRDIQGISGCVVRTDVKDDEGNPVSNVPYRILDSGKPIQSGVTNSQGMTERIETSRLEHVTLELENEL